MIPSFPKFAPLTFQNKDDYERLVSGYPPLSDISFSSLQIWWNLDDQLSLSMIDDNIVINYRQSFDEINSGYCIIGETDLDNSIDRIFEYLSDRSELIKLVHVPEFVVKKISNIDKYNLEEEIDYNEYILDSRALASLEDPLHGRTRRKVKRFLREVEDRKVEVKELDLSDPAIQKDLLETVTLWEGNKKSNNDPDSSELKAMKKTIQHGANMGIVYLALYIDDKPYAVILYHLSHDSNYYIIHHLKVDYSIPFIFDYVTHHIANRAAKEDVNFLNMEMDLGIENMRRHKMGLRPVDFFRKYTITPNNK